MIIKKCFILVIIFLSVSFAQGHRRPAVTPFHSQIPFYAVVHVIPGDSLNEINYLYRIPYNQLVFVKENSHYEAELSLSVEVYDTSRNFIARQIKEDNISVGEFSKTNSPELYAQGLIQFKLPNHEYDLVPVITDKQSGQEAKLNHFRIKKLNSKFLDFLLPIVVNETKIRFNNENVFQVTNFEGFIPFDQYQYKIIFPSLDTSISQINVTITNNRDTVFKGPITESFISSNDLAEYDGNIIIKNKQGRKQFKNFVLDNIVGKLKVGDLKISVSKSDSTRYSDFFLKQVVWFNKPFSLQNSEFAIKALKYMANDSVVSKVLDTSKDKYKASLSNFWDKYDPTPATQFNELMNEYYLRVDFALRHFSTLTGKSGADTDRGKIFIKFGKPSFIERSSDDYGRVVERWVYRKEKLNFIFIDKNGTGEFPLAKG
jgi:GWxTD domain-containing protein